jgi:hypothetical protein
LDVNYDDLFCDYNRVVGLDLWKVYFNFLLKKRIFFCSYNRFEFKNSI